MRTTNHFGKELEKLRKESGVSRSGLAASVHISSSHFYSVEIGKNAPPSPETIDRLERELLLEKGTLFRKAMEDGYVRIPPIVVSAVTVVDRLDKLMEFMELVANGVQIPWDEVMAVANREECRKEV
jgi:transcriptional regulator with XRE-family HTH domain